MLTFTLYLYKCLNLKKDENHFAFLKIKDFKHICVYKKHSVSTTVDCKSINYVDLHST